MGRSTAETVGTVGADALATGVAGTGAAGAELQVAKDCVVARMIANANGTELRFTNGK